MARETIHTCDKCGKRFQDSETAMESYVNVQAIETPRRRDSEVSLNMDFCFPCFGLIEEEMRASVASAIDEDIEDDGTPGGTVTDITKHHVD